MMPWTRWKLDATRALKEQAVASRNEVCRIALLLQESNPVCAKALQDEMAILMTKAVAAQGWLRSKRAVKGTP